MATRRKKLAPTKQHEVYYGIVDGKRVIRFNKNDYFLLPDHWQSRSFILTVDADGDIQKDTNYHQIKQLLKSEDQTEWVKSSMNN